MAVVEVNASHLQDKQAFELEERALLPGFIRQSNAEVFELRKKSVLLALFFVLLLSVGAVAQSHELAITAGGNFPSNNYYDPSKSFAVGAQYDGRIIHVPLASLYVDVPFVISTHTSFTDPVLGNIRDNYQSYYLTPGLKLKLAPEFPISPYVVGGVGFAHYRTTTSSAFSASNNKAIYEIGGGLDMKVAPFFSVRGEVRDFIGGVPNFATLTDAGHQHNIVPQLGLVFRF